MGEGVTEYHTRLEKWHMYGNNGLGRYVIVTGSPERSVLVSEHMFERRLIKGTRGHNTYIGKFKFYDNGNEISVDVATLPTGMGAPTAGIIVDEVIKAGARRIIRIGTAGSLVNYIKTGHIFIVESAYRDEHTSDYYFPRKYPARAHPDVVRAMKMAAEEMIIEGLIPEGSVHSGMTHTKDDLWMEFYMDEENISPYRFSVLNNVWKEIRRSGCKTTSMECSNIFIRTEYEGIKNAIKEGKMKWGDIYESLENSHGSKLIKLKRVPDGDEYWNIIDYKAGATQAIIGDTEPFSNNEVLRDIAEKNAIELGIKSIKFLYKIDEGLI